MSICFGISLKNLKSIVNLLKESMQENGNLTDNLILLASLLNSTKFLKNIFIYDSNCYRTSIIEKTQEAEAVERVYV